MVPSTSTRPWIWVGPRLRGTGAGGGTPRRLSWTVQSDVQAGSWGRCPMGSKEKVTRIFGRCPTETSVVRNPVFPFLSFPTVTTLGSDT